MASLIQWVNLSELRGVEQGGPASDSGKKRLGNWTG